MDLSSFETELLARLQILADTHLEPNAEIVDQAGIVPLANLNALAAEGFVGITTPRAFGGSETSPLFRHAFNEVLCAACGTTFFVVTQHLGSCGQFAASENPYLRETFLKAMASGDHWVGVAFGHLRRPQPMVLAEPVDGGWVVNGVAPWVTGWPILAGMIVGAHLPDGRHIYLYCETDNAAHLRSSPPLGLCAMGATETTEVFLDDYFVPEKHWLRYSSREELARGDLYNAAMTTAPMLGVTMGSLKTVRDVAVRRPLPALVRAADALAAELAACRAECLDCIASFEESPAYKARAHAARAWAIELGVRAGHMAVAAASGPANNLTHPAQRRLREAMFYTVYQQTGDIAEAVLDRLVRPEFLA